MNPEPPITIVPPSSRTTPRKKGEPKSGVVIPSETEDYIMSKSYLHKLYHNNPKNRRGSRGTK